MRARTWMGWGAAVGAAAAFAGTPDGIEPPREAACDGLVGNAQGLCIAYCEAMDCDDPRHVAADGACRRVATQFARATGGAQPPCVHPTTCTVDAQDDGLDLTEPAPWTLAVLDNDTVTGGGATIVAHDAPADITLDAEAGTFSGAWTDAHEAYVRSFTYTACCAEGICDTATVTILGS